MEANPKTTSSEELGLESLLVQLATTSPPRYLSSSAELSHVSRKASELLFSALIPLCRKGLRLDRLHTDQNFDAEQIWHQIDLQSTPLVRSVRRDLRKFEGLESREMRELFGGVVEEEREDFGREEENTEEESDDENEEDENDEKDEEEEIGGEEEEDTGDEEEEVEEKGNESFFDTNELKDYLDKEETKEYGGTEYDEIEEDDEIDELDDGESGDERVYDKYEDFYGRRKKTSSSAGKDQQAKKKSKHAEEECDPHDKQVESFDESQDSETNNDQKDAMELNNQNDEMLSTFEKQSKKSKSQIEQIEKELVAPKSWTMIGEVTASKRPKNSALEVDLDFQHNRGRPPLATEESTASIEELILKCIREGTFDEVQRAPVLPSNLPKDAKELDDSKSKKGLAEIYEEEYAQKTGLASAPISLCDELKQEATDLFKKLCFKLDALSHFHFTPKPVIEDMSIQANVPALAMEEIAPLAVSDAAMLAPEEIFTGIGDVKEDKELTKEDRKRRRAKNKRKFKALSVKRAAKKARGSSTSEH